MTTEKSIKSKWIYEILEPDLLEIFWQFQLNGLNKLSTIKELFESQFQKIKNGKLIFSKLTKEEYSQLCERIIYPDNYEEDQMHILRCILRIQRDIDNLDLVKLEMNATLSWIKKFYERTDRKKLVDAQAEINV